MFAATCILMAIIVFGFLFNQGLWSNSIMLINLLVAGAIATNWWEPLTRMLVSNIPRSVWLADVIVLWLLFALALGVLRGFTGQLCKINVRFPKTLETVCGPAMGIVVALVFMFFFAFTVNLAPLAPKPFDGSFDVEAPKKNMFGLMSPDRVWIRIVKTMSRGAYYNANDFDGFNDLTIVYQERRKLLKEQENIFKR